MKVRSAVYAPVLFGVVLILVGFSARFVTWMGEISSNPFLSLAIIQFLVFLLPLAFYRGVRGISLSSALRFNGFPVKKLPFAAVMAALMFIVIFFCRYLGIFWFHDAMTNTPSAIYQPIPTDSVMLGIICNVLLPAILEEVLFRGVLLEEYRIYGAGFAVCMSAAMFAMIHIAPANLFFYFCQGLILGAVTVVTESILPAFIIHALSNFTYFYARRNAAEYVRQAGKSPLLPYILFGAILLLLFVAFSRLEDLYRDQSYNEMLQSRKELLYLELDKNKTAEEEPEPSFWARLSEILLSPTFLAAAALYVLFAAGIL